MLATMGRPGWCDTDPKSIRIATFVVDVTIPLGHRCMGLLPTKANRVDDPLQARGIVWLGAGRPIVLVCFDWCEIRNDSYDRWRRVIADAAGTLPERVLVSCNHQHDAPVIDAGAQRLLDDVGLANELYDVAFQQRMMERVRREVIRSLTRTRSVTHVGIGKARVERIASSRRIVHPDGRVGFDRGSSSGRRALYRDAPTGKIDPWLRTISFWDGDQPLAAISCYATHPMSYYGRGGISWDFVGMARERRQRDDNAVHQIYVTGCSGDVTAGKYNDGEPSRRAELADRLYAGMVDAWRATRRLPLGTIAFRVASLKLPYRDSPSLNRARLERRLRDSRLRTEDRIWAAMSLSSRQRVASGRAIDVPCIDFGFAQIVLLPGESFVAYQLAAQSLRPQSFVMAIGYGECWPGYIPTDADFDDGFRDKWLWVGRGAEARLLQALREVLCPAPNHEPPAKGAPKLPSRN